MSFAAIAPFLSTRRLHLILMPTEQCNFRCVYCYEDFQHGEMSRAVVDSIKALLARRIVTLDRLSLEWFGGEPLLALPIVEEIQGYAFDLARRHAAIHFAGSMTTNGSLLTRRRFERLLGLEVRDYQISLDGTQETHDSMRQRLGGGGSFKTIWSNLLAMREVAEQFLITLRLHIWQANLDAVDRLLVDLSRAFGGDSRFEVQLKAIRRFGGPNDERLPVLTSEEEAAALRRLSRRATELGFPDRQDVYAQPGMLQGCYAAALGSYVVRSTGELAKCTVALDHPNNRLGKLQSDGTVAIDAAKMTGWLRGALEGDRASLECPMLGWADDHDPRRIEESPPSVVQIGAGRPANRRFGAVQGQAAG
jgi:uncharacterized protein